MPVTTKAIATSTTAAALVTQSSRRTAFYVTNEDGTNAVRIGPSGVTNASGAIGTRGLRIAAGETLPIVREMGADEAWFVIADAGTPTVSVAEVRS